MDKNRSTAIASILRFVSEFLQSILVRCRVFACDILQSSFVQSVVELLHETFCNRVCAIGRRVFVIVNRL